jgi:hypothetical protein
MDESLKNGQNRVHLAVCKLSGQSIEKVGGHFVLERQPLR